MLKAFISALHIYCKARKKERGDDMEPKRVTLLLPYDVIEAAERAAAAQGKTRHNFLCGLIVSQIGAAAEDKTTARIREITDLQRVSISILARIWGEQNPNAPKIIMEMMRNLKR